MGDYYDLYLKTDILFLADVFEQFISTCLEYYGLNPCHNFSDPRLIWDAILKMNKIELELILVIDIYLFIEKGMTGSIFYIAKRHTKANNKYMQSYDKKKPRKCITYLHVNNLYNWTMSQYLPYSGLKQSNHKEIDKFDLNSIECNSIEKKQS